jgi:hypothetical protein
VHLSQFDGSQSATSSGVSPGFKMRVDIEDHEGYTISAEKTVNVGGFLQKPLAQLAAGINSPIRFDLAPNFPNPFSAKGGSAHSGNPIPTIAYQLPEEAPVRLAIYNAAGALVAELVNEVQPGPAFMPCRGTRRLLPAVSISAVFRRALFPLPASFCC